MKKVFLAFAVFAFLFSCKKDKTPDPVIYAEENPLTTFLANGGVTKVASITTNNTSLETGYKFKATVNGKINAVAVQLPTANPSIRLTIWDKATATALRTENINVTNANAITETPISPLDIIKDKEYLISINTKQYYNRYKTDSSSIIYPQTVNNIVILGCSFLITPNQTMPSNSNTYAYWGDVSFKFQQTN